MKIALAFLTALCLTLPVACSSSTASSQDQACQSVSTKVTATLVLGTNSPAGCARTLVVIETLQPDGSRATVNGESCSVSCSADHQRATLACNGPVATAYVGDTVITAQTVAGCRYCAALPC